MRHLTERGKNLVSISRYERYMLGKEFGMFYREIIRILAGPGDYSLDREDFLRHASIIIDDC